MKKGFKVVTALLLATSCAVSGAACSLFEGQTHSNLKKEGWEEIVEYAENLKTYRVILAKTKTGEDVIVETYESDSERAEPRFTYNKVGNAAGTIADEYIMMDAEEDTFRYSREYDAANEMWRTVKRNVTPLEEEKDAAIAAFKHEYDLRVDMLGVTYYPEGNSDGVELKDLYDYLKYTQGIWKGEMAFNLSDALYTGTVEVENMPDTVESFRKNSKGLLFRLTLTTTTEGVTFKWSYDIQSHTSGFVVNPPSNAEFIE